MGNAEKRAKRAREKAKAARRQPPTAAQIAKAKAASRTCGDCQACCTGMNIAALEKPRQTRCPHQCATGCAIYQTRPTECVEYLCLWRQGWGDENQRPDKLGAIIDMTDGRGLYEVGGGRPGGHPMRFTMVEQSETPPFDVQHAMNEFLRIGQVVVLSYPDKQIVFGPKTPNGLAFTQKTLDEIDEAIKTKNGGRDVRVNVIPQSNGYARVTFTPLDEQSYGPLQLADGNPGALAFAGELYVLEDGDARIEKLVKAGVTGELAALLFQVVLERDLSKLDEFIDRPDLKDFLAGQLA